MENNTVKELHTVPTEPKDFTLNNIGQLINRMVIKVHDIVLHVYYILIALKWCIIFITSSRIFVGANDLPYGALLFLYFLRLAPEYPEPRCWCYQDSASKILRRAATGLLSMMRELTDDINVVLGILVKLVAFLNALLSTGIKLLRGEDDGGCVVMDFCDDGSSDWDSTDLEGSTCDCDDGSSEWDSTDWEGSTCDCDDGSSEWDSTDWEGSTCDCDDGSREWDSTGWEESTCDCDNH